MRGDFKYSVMLHNISEDAPGRSPCFVYFLFDGQFVKIGIADDVVKRIGTIQTSNARKIELLAYRKYGDRLYALKAEKELHSFWEEHRANGEWFDIADDNYFAALLRSKHVSKDIYKSPKNGVEIRCTAIDEYGESRENVIDLTEAIAKMRAFYNGDRTVLINA